MKRTILLTTIILCVVIFFTTTIAGIVLTITTVGWKGLLSADQMGTRFEQFVDQVENWGRNVSVGPLTNYTIDETRTDGLNGIEKIVITGISESITVSAEGSQLSARMSGSYRAGSPLVWNATRDGKVLRIKADYPRWGFRTSSLMIAVQIPASFKGDVEIHAVSGDGRILNPKDVAWASVDFTGVSGSLTAETAVWPKIDVNCVSGQIKVASLSGKANLKTVSGRIQAAYAATDPKDLKVDTVSGKVELLLPESAKFNVVFETVSGSFDSSKLPVQVTTQITRRIEANRNGGGATLSVKTVSGGLQLSPAP